MRGEDRKYLYHTKLELLQQHHWVTNTRYAKNSQFVHELINNVSQASILAYNIQQAPI